MDLTLIPIRDSFSEFLVSANEISTIIRPHYFGDTSPCDEAARGVHERISVHTLGDFQVYGSGRQTREQNSITLNLTSGPLDPKRAETFNAHETERGFARCDSVTRKRSRRKTKPANIQLDHSSVINLSSSSLSADEISVLARGLIFCPTPRHINWSEVSADIYDFSRRMRPAEYFF